MYTFIIKYYVLIKLPSPYNGIVISVRFFDDLIQAVVLKPFPGMIEGASIDNESEHFMAPNGINSVVKHFLNSSGRSCGQFQI
jgi:hypothetical protein